MPSHSMASTIWPGRVGCWAAKSIQYPDAPYCAVSGTPAALRCALDVALERVQRRLISGDVTEVRATGLGVGEVPAQYLGALGLQLVRVEVGRRERGPPLLEVLAGL